MPDINCYCVAYFIDGMLPCLAHLANHPYIATDCWTQQCTNKGLSAYRCCENVSVKQKNLSHYTPFQVSDGNNYCDMLRGSCTFSTLLKYYPLSAIMSCLLYP